MKFGSDPNLSVFAQVAILLALVAPELRAAGSRAYRRVFPFDALRIGVGAIGYVAIVLGIAFVRPNWLLIPTLIALGVIAYLAWRARPSYGVADRLPPGSLERLPVRPWSDPEFYKHQATRYGNVFKMSQFGQPMVCVVGLERANRLLLQHDEQLVAPPLPFSRFIEGGYLRYLPEETHSKYRKFFRALFYSDVMKNAEPRVRAAFARGFDAMCTQSSQNGGVRVREATMRTMFAAWAELFYGIDEQHADFARLKELYHVIDIRRARWSSKTRIDPVLSEIEAIMRRRASELAGDDSAPWCFLVSLARTHPEALNDRTILGNLIYTMQVTWGDVTGLLLWVFKMLSDHPEWRERLACEPSRELATRIVQETLRLEQSESRYRRATADLEIDGFRIPKNWLVRVCVRESHQDETIFPNAKAFNPDRFTGRSHTRGEYAPFGAFRLACIGEDLSKTVAAIYALELVTRFDWRVVSDGPAEISSWAHNAPNTRLAVTMTRRTVTA